jgi:hypothetical protein
MFGFLVYGGAIMKNKPYTEEEKRAILAIVDGCELFAQKVPKERRLNIGFIISLITRRSIMFDSWRRNIKRWREELEPVPYVPVENHAHEWKYSHTFYDSDGLAVTHWYACECGMTKEKRAGS